MLPLLLLASWLPWNLATPSSFGTDGPTLFPGRVRDGETLRFVIDGPVLGRPERGADTLAVHERGEVVVARAELLIGPQRWVALSDSGWVEAARLDRPAPPIDGDLEAGREGLAGGRVLPWDWRPTDLVQLPDSLKLPGYEGRSLRMRREAAESFASLVAAAEHDGLVIRAFSAFRSAEYQTRLYGRTVARDATQRESAAPGRSEHQLGTTVDVGTPGVGLADAALAETDAGRWLDANAASFGFVVSFSRHRHTDRGVAFEPWHLRWVGGAVEDDSGW